MKINGDLIGAPEPRYVYFKRGDRYITFVVNAVLSFEDFDLACPKPKPKQRQRPGQEPEPLIDQDFRRRTEEYYERRSDWTILKSIEDTPGLTWDKVDMNKPETWGKYTDEMLASGLTTGEINWLIREVNNANLVTEKTMEEIRESFFRSTQGHQQSSQSETGEVSDTSSGEPVSV